jgi:Protein of unknown function (DUF2628)
MAIYTVHLPPDAKTPDNVAEKAVFVKEGFAVGGFVFTGLWLIYNRMWLLALGYGAVFGLTVAGFAFFKLPPIAFGAITFLLAGLIGIEGNEWVRRKYSGQSWLHAGTVSGPSLAECERRFFKNWLSERDAPATVAAVPPTLPPPMQQPSQSQVLGVFPTARGQA